MPLIILILALLVLKYFAIGPVANLSWWWIIGLMGIAFLWFEFIEKMLGFDKRKPSEQKNNARK